MKENTLQIINNEASLLPNEFDRNRIRQQVVLRLLNESGWDIYDNSSVLISGAEDTAHADLVIKVNELPYAYFFIRQGAPSESDEQLFTRCLARNGSIRLIIVTNGIDWQAYTSSQNTAAPLLRFLSFHARETGGDLDLFAELIQKETLSSECSTTIINAIRQSKLLQEETKNKLAEMWNTMIKTKDRSLLDTLCLNYYMNHEKDLDDRTLALFFNEHEEHLTLKNRATSVEFHEPNHTPSNFIPFPNYSSNDPIRVLKRPIDATYNKPISISIDGKLYNTSNWKQMYECFMNCLFQKVGDLLIHKSPIHAPKHTIRFSTRNAEFTTPHKIKGTNYYHDTHYSSFDIVSNILYLSQRFGVQTEIKFTEGHRMMMLKRTVS